MCVAAAVFLAKAAMTVVAVAAVFVAADLTINQRVGVLPFGLDSHIYGGRSYWDSNRDSYINWEQANQAALNGAEFGLSFAGGYAAQGLIKRGLGFAVQKGLLSAGRVGVTRFGASILADTAIGTGLSMGFHGESFGQALPINIAGAFLGNLADLAITALKPIFTRMKQTSAYTKFMDWFAYWKDRGGVTAVSPRGRIFINNREITPGSFAWRDTQAHEAFHAWLMRDVRIVPFLGELHLGPIPVGAPIKYLEEVAAYTIGHIAAFRPHAILTVPRQALRSLDLGEQAVTLVTMGLGAVGYAVYKHGHER